MNNSTESLFQKYFPYILILITLVFGGYLLFKKGILAMPSFSKKDNVVDVGKNVIDIIFAGEEYKLSYNSLPPENLINIAKFDKTETWAGEGSLEEGATKDETVMSMIDRGRQKAQVYLMKSLNLASVGLIKFTVNLKSDPDDLESFSILFSDAGLKSYYRFPVTNLKEGINYLAIPKHRFFLSEGNDQPETETLTVTQVPGISWDRIERVQLELISRPGGKASLDIGWMRGEKEDVFNSEWSWGGEDHFLNLDTAPDGKLVLFVQNIGGNVATLRKVGSVKNFSYTVKITTQRPGTIGMFARGDYKTGYGYYFAVGGLGNNEWSVTKYHLESGSPKTSLLINGQISNFAFSKDQPFWLKATLRDNSLTYYFSLDNKDFTKLGSVSDNEFDAGGVGVAVAAGGAGYFDDFNLLTK